MQKLRQDSKSVNKDFIVRMLITGVYFSINLYLLFQHESWRDEAQAWLIARDLSIIDIVKQMQFEGHPCLWHLILLPFAKLGFPYITMNYISLLIMTVTVYLFISYSPFNRLTKLILILGSCFLYFYPVVSRSYCLVALLVILVSITYKSRLTHPVKYAVCLALLAQTHVLVLGFVFGLWLSFTIEWFIKRREYQTKRLFAIGSALPVFSVLLLGLQLFGSWSMNATVSSTTSASRSALAIADNSKAYAMQLFRDFFQIEFPAKVFIPILIGIGIVFLYFAIQYPRQGLIVFFAITFQIFVHCFIYSAGMMQKKLILLYFLLFAIWSIYYETPHKLKFLQRANKRRLESVFSLLLVCAFVLTVPAAIKQMKNEIELPYSLSKETAEYINAVLPADSILVVTNDAKASALTPYFKKQRLWSPVTEEFFTYVTWNDARSTVINPTEVLKRVKEQLNGYENIYILEQKENLLISKDSLEKIVVFKKGCVTDENYYAIYKLT